MNNVLLWTQHSIGWDTPAQTWTANSSSQTTPRTRKKTDESISQNWDHWQPRKRSAMDSFSPAPHPCSPVAWLLFHPLVDEPTFANHSKGVLCYLQGESPCHRCSAVWIERIYNFRITAREEAKQTDCSGRCWLNQLEWYPCPPWTRCPRKVMLGIECFLSFDGKQLS